MADRITYGDDGELDEVVVSDVQSVHIERMHAGSVWMSIRCDDRTITVWLNSKRKIAGTATEITDAQAEENLALLAGED